jgi:hypothetical protein
MKTNTERYESRFESDFPKSWNWDEDGDTVEGTFVELGEAPTAGYGHKPILTLDVDGEHRTVWVFHTSLANKLSEELRRRKERDFVPGERILIRRGERKTSEATGRTYVPYRVQFPEGPKRTAADVLDSVSELTEEADEDEGDIPF